MKLFISNIFLICSILITPAFACDNEKLDQLKIETRLQEQKLLLHEAEIKAIEVAHRLEETRKKHPEAAKLVRERLKEG